MAPVFEATRRNGSRADLKMLQPELVPLSDIRLRFPPLLRLSWKTP